MITEGYCPTLNIKSDRLAEKPMKVYAVFEGSMCYDASLIGIFSTLEKAEEATKEKSGWVEEYELDNPES